MKMEIEIKTKSPAKALELKKAHFPDGVSIKGPEMRMSRGFAVNSQEWVTIVIEFAGSTAAAVVAGLILKKLGKDPASTKVRVNRKEVEYSEGSIVRSIEETIEIEQE